MTNRPEASMKKEKNSRRGLSRHPQSREIKKEPYTDMANLSANPAVDDFLSLARGRLVCASKAAAKS
jgi:hypothetical protein